MSTCVVYVLLLSMISGLHSAAFHDQRYSLTQDVDLRQDMSLSDYIWNEALDLLPKAWNTTFIAGVANGSLDPNFYGIYVLQDAIYCRVVAQLWTELANDQSVPEEVRNYANNTIDGYKDCAAALFARWSVKDDGENNYGIIMGEYVKTYVSFINHTMKAHPPNMLIATYACLKLWYNLTEELIVIVPDSNPYKVWVIENRDSGDSMRMQAEKMNQWDQQYPTWYNRSEARSLFQTAMMSEINFFDKGSGAPSNYTSFKTRKVYKVPTHEYLI